MLENFCPPSSKAINFVGNFIELNIRLASSSLILLISKCFYVYSKCSEEKNTTILNCVIDSNLQINQTFYDYLKYELTDHNIEIDFRYQDQYKQSKIKLDPAFESPNFYVIKLKNLKIPRILSYLGAKRLRIVFLNPWCEAPKDFFLHLARSARRNFLPTGAKHQQFF